uniref:Uncharacterized protein n=1 Tax=Timema poppense TaxID=170557 RepID=A0A7R9H6D7_TIMPO|nr:unnamed protein product [Timema poppensis]
MASLTDRKLNTAPSALFIPFPKGCYTPDPTTFHARLGRQNMVQSAPDQRSSPDLIVFGSLVQHESSALDQAATEFGQANTGYSSIVGYVSYSCKEDRSNGLDIGYTACLYKLKTDQRARLTTNSKLMVFLRNVDLEELIQEVVRASNRGVSAARNVSGEPNWSFGQSLFFSSTVVTTIGEGTIFSATENAVGFYRTAWLEPLGQNRLVRTAWLEPLGQNHLVRTAWLEPLGQNRLVRTAWSEPLGYNHLVRTAWLEPLGQNRLVRTTWSEPLGQNRLVRTAWLEPLGQNRLVRTTWSEPLGQNHLVRTAWLEPLGQNRLVRTTWSITLDTKT